MELANAVEPVQDGRSHIEKINGPFLSAQGHTSRIKAGLDLAIANGWLVMHEGGTYVKFTPAERCRHALLGLGSRPASHAPVRFPPATADVDRLQDWICVMISDGDMAPATFSRA
jgi:hypothetical protein